MLRRDFSILTLMGLLFLPLCAAAQTSTSTLTGTVRDASGGVLPGVTVGITDTARNANQSTVTNDVGSYAFPSLVPGGYSITAQLPGFQRFVREGVIFQVAQVASVDIQLVLGAITESVEVTAATPMLETETSSRGSVITSEKIVELPLNGRDYNQLALLSPGVV